MEEWLATAGYDGSNFDPPSWVVGSGTIDANNRSQATGLWSALQVLTANENGSYSDLSSHPVFVQQYQVHGAVLGGLARFGKALWPPNDWFGFVPASPTPIAAPTGLPEGSRFFSLGRTDNTLNYFDGALADVRVYDYALSASEVAAAAADE